MNTQDFQGIVELEIKQREEELCDKKLVLEARAEYKRIAESESPDKRAQLESLLATVNAMESPLESQEPSTLEEIRSLRPKGPRSIERIFSYAELYDRIYGAWLGRCAGNQLGNPVEGFTKENARIAAELSTGYPLTNYYGAIVNPPPSIYHSAPSPRSWSVDDECLGERIFPRTAGRDITYLHPKNSQQQPIEQRGKRIGIVRKDLFWQAPVGIGSKQN